MDPTTFIERWRASGASERANYALFLTELCDVLGVDHPDPASDASAENAYTFERVVTFREGDKNTSGFIDLYRRGCFVLEAKQGSDPVTETERAKLGLDTVGRKTGHGKRGKRVWERTMERAKNQAFRYARALPPDDGWPPFLVVVDVGYCFDLYADFSRQGKHYVPFPDPQRYRVKLDDLDKEDVLGLLRQLWTDPMQLDPARRSARVTRTLATRLAKLAASLEEAGHEPDTVAQFLMRCLFTMFAEDVGLLPERGFTRLLTDYQGSLEHLPKALTALWKVMDQGGFSPSLRSDVVQFNGKLFAGAEAITLSEAQLDLLIEAARADWKDVEPAIFGTLLERALDPRERHRLGAHYTPRAYVERLVMPTVIEPLREEWVATQAAALLREEERDEAAARAEIEAFHKRLCSVRVLDPACGSGNFLFVVLEHLKRLEAEVLLVLDSYAGQTTLDMTGGYRVTPEQLLGLEINPRAAAIADVVLWIGYLQWHFRTYGDAQRLDAPILKEYKNIRLQDAVLAYDERKPRLDEAGEPVTRWDGQTMKVHPATGEEVPDETAQTPVYDYTNPRPAEWPEAEYIVGNPPFIGPARMREALGDGYTEALREAYKGEVGDSSDLVIYWWHKAAVYVRKGKAQRFGFIATNSLRQTFNRRVLQAHMEAKKPLSLVYAVPDHPWVDSADGAAVRISMTVGEAGKHEGRLQTVTSEARTDELGRKVELSERRGMIQADLRIGADLDSANPLMANQNLTSRGVMLFGKGFIVTPEEAVKLGFGTVEGLEKHIRPYRNGRDLTSTPRGVMVIDLFGLKAKQVRDKYPAVYQWMYERVKPERDANRNKSIRENWWIHGRPRSEIRPALAGLPRYIATVETSKHTFFQFLDASILPDNKLLAIALDDAYHLGVLSSHIHVTWALATGSRLVDRPVYVKTQCFEPFPFPDATAKQQARIRQLGETLDTHRKNRLAAHDKLTMTELYNVMEKLRAGEPLTKKDQRTNEQGLVSVLLQIHNELDAAVADAYGWPTDLADDEILARLVALNHERAAEEAAGFIRYLRPSYQHPEGVQTELVPGVTATTTSTSQREKEDWPKDLPDQMKAIHRILAAEDRPATTEQVASRFHRAPRKQVAMLLDTLTAIGLARLTETGGYTG